LSKKFDLYCWACDFSEDRGEGILARHYAINLSRIKKISICVNTPSVNYQVYKNNIIKINSHEREYRNLNFNFFQNYFYPFLGIFFLWVHFFKKHKVCYLNFLPLWNIFIFYLSPPKTHFGPITGFVYNNKINSIKSFLRKYLNNLLFKINLKIIFLRQRNYYFSTELLKDVIDKKYQKRIIFNYLLNLIKLKKNNYKKNIDILIYNRNYFVKNNLERNKLLSILINNNFNVSVVGDFLYIEGVRNYGFIKRKKVISLLNRTRFIINSGENPYNIYTIDAYNSGSQIIYEDKFKGKIKFFNRGKIHFVNFSDKKKILKIFNSYKSSNNSKNYNKLNNVNLNYFKSI
jgi:hypothetical protein